MYKRQVCCELAHTLIAPAVKLNTHVPQTYNDTKIAHMQRLTRTDMTNIQGILKTHMQET